MTSADLLYSTDIPSGNNLAEEQNSGNVQEGFGKINSNEEEQYPDKLMPGAGAHESGTDGEEKERKESNEADPDVPLSKE